MKKIFLSLILISMIAIPAVTYAALCPTLVPQTCGQGGTLSYDSNGNCTSGSACPCGISDFFQMLLNIYNFIVQCIAGPLAIIALTVGGIMMMISAGNPNLLGTGKKILYSAIIGLALVFCSWIIINFVSCTALGYCSWSSI